MTRIILAILLWSAAAWATDAVDIEEHLGRTLPLEMSFKDQDGHSVKLGDVLVGDTPTVLVLAYYECPMLCGLVLQGLVEATEKLDWKVGERYRLLTISFDPKDGPHNADLKRRSVLDRLNKSDMPWPFLVGKEAEIQALTEALGFRYVYDAGAKQFAHPSAAFVITPGGMISRYLYGVQYPVRDLKLALIEAGEGKTGSAFERFILTCFRYNPATRRYGPYVFGFLRTGSLLVAFALGISIYRLRRRERARGGS
jgi:protein SCO1/2